MQQCSQAEGQSVYQHGISVNSHIFQLINYLETGDAPNDWKLPTWVTEYRYQLRDKLLAREIIGEYTIFHDCGKPYCLIIDEDGKRHFPNHAKKSYQTWLGTSGNLQVAKLIKMDMIIHTMKAADIDEFVTHPEAVTLMLVGLAEIHSNAKMFGGLDSTSFKIKWGQINKRGKAICLKLFGSNNVSID